MIDADLLRRLNQIVGRQHVSAGRADAEVYSYDASLAVAAPDAVVFPADTRQTADVVRAATRARVPYVPRGFGTNLSGGSVARRGGLVVGLSRLNRVLEVNPAGRYAVVQSGVTNLELQETLAPAGLFYAPDPASQKVATLGGNVGENSGGPHCLKYGVTSNHVLGLTVVLPGGEIVQAGGPALDPPGYDLRGVLIGSEGTLGIVTELVLRILPSPEAVITMLAVYDDHGAAARSVSAVIAAGIVPATLEMMDSTVIRAVEDSKPCGYPRDAAAVLIVEVDGPVAGLKHQAEQIRWICMSNGCREVREAKDAAQRNLLWSGRRGAFGAIARLAPSFLVADCTVPRTELPKALAQVAAIAERHRLAHGNVFHAGDGNLHPLLLFDSRNPEQVTRVHQAGDEIMRACVDLGGTISGEHGVGMEKIEAMRMIFSDHELDFQRALRRAFDPDDLLNPGKITPPDDGAAGVGLAGQAAGFRVQGPGLQDELTPVDVAEACDIVRRACRDGVVLLPVGGGSQLDSGVDSTPRPVLLRSTGLCSTIEYDPANQVIAAGSGTSLAVLGEVLAEHGQWLPVRPPGGGHRTLGGLTASGSSGPARLRYGTPRDLLLGLKFVSGTGEPIAAGGRVVKNVAGYDLTRLMTGSAGTLGFITQLTFRVSAMPECCTAVEASGSFDRCAAAAAELIQSKLEPTLVIAVPDRAELKADGNVAWRLIAGFEGFRETVDSQAAGCREIVDRVGLDVRPRREYQAKSGPCGEFFGLLQRSPFRVKANLPLDKVAGFVTDGEALPHEAAVLVDFGCGRILAGTESLTDEAWHRFCKTSHQAAGHAVLEKAPTEFIKQHDPFGTPDPSWQLMRRIKAVLDPHNVFAPDRVPKMK